ncbi:hypothetical protein [Streptomyces sp. NPDC021224]|uniref:hypothetical protein n=1 Tax=unclassified Streptomyces TaxID=2593676 RepID=UPI0037ABDC12
MAAAEHADYAEDEDALFVLTAAMLTAERFPGVLGDDYPAACEQLGLDPLPDGYGLMFGQDGRGARWTVVTTDAALVACALAAWDCGLEYELAPQEETLAASLPGWPLPVAVAVPDVPDPHDPAEEEAGPALTPPDVSVWGPPQRRLGADEIAVHWHEWRDQLPPSLAPADVSPDTAPDPSPGAAPDTAPAPAPQEAADSTGAGTDGEKAASGTAASGTGEAAPDADAPPAGPDAETAPGPADAAAPAEISHPGVRRALAEAAEYVSTPPPPGRVRTTAGSLRADGPGWSLVARTDDIAFVLLDDAPGEVMPVGRGRSLPHLLEALDKLAGSPS